MNSVILNLIPVFILALIGFIAGRLKLLPENASDALCSFLFLFCAPATAFNNIVNADISEIFNMRFFIAVTISEVIMFGLFFLFYKKIMKQDGSTAVIRGLVSMYGNISYVGIPIFLVLFDNAIPNIITLLIHGLITFPLMIFLLDWYAGEQHNSILHSALVSFRNPNIFIPIIAVIMLLLKIKVPVIITNTAQLLGAPTTTVGMFALGLSCSKNIRAGISGKLIGEALLAAFFKLILYPLTSYLFGRFGGSLPWWFWPCFRQLSMTIYFHSVTIGMKTSQVWRFCCLLCFFQLQSVCMCNSLGIIKLIIRINKICHNS